jgi:hypothetical protein
MLMSFDVVSLFPSITIDLALPVYERMVDNEIEELTLKRFHAMST